MTPLPPVPGVLKFDLSYLVGSDATALSRLFWTYTGGPPSDGDCDLIAEHVSNSWSDQMAAMFGTANTLEHVECTDLTSATSGQGIFVGSIVGTRDGDPLSASACALSAYSVPVRYRGGKARTYWPAGVYTDLLTRQAWTSDFITAMNNAVAQFIAEVSGGAVGTTALEHQQMVSYYSGTLASPSPTNPDRYINRPVRKVTPDHYPATFLTTRPNVASQRRRNLQRA